jgi:hypothetical protein
MKGDTVGNVKAWSRQTKKPKFACLILLPKIGKRFILQRANQMVFTS